MMSDNQKALFIHADFRTSSTFFVKALRFSAPSRVFYEPLHEALAAPLRFASGRSATVDLQGGEEHGHPFEKYSDIEGPLGGVRHYRKSFSAERLYLAADAHHPALLKYIRYLLDSAALRGRLPVVKEVRSQGRIAWMKKNFEGLHIALVRNPASQFRSYVWNRMHNNDYFMAKLCQAFAYNAQPYASNWTSQIASLPVFSDEYYANEIAFYERLSRTIPTRTLSFIFMYMWWMNMRSVLENADLVVEFPLSDSALRHVNRVIDPYNASLVMNDFHESRANNEIFEDSVINEMAPLALSCLAIDDRSYKTISKRSDLPVFVSKSMTSYFDALTVAAPDPSSLVGSHPRERPHIELRQREVHALSSQDSSRYSPPFLQYGFRRETDGDDELSFSAQALYLPPSSIIRQFGDSGQAELVCSAYDKSTMVCFGPHMPIEPGRYSLSYDVRIESLKSDRNGRSYSAIEVWAEGGTKLIAPQRRFEGFGKRRIEVTFDISGRLETFEPRLYAGAAVVSVTGMHLQKLPDVQSS